MPYPQWRRTSKARLSRVCRRLPQPEPSVPRRTDDRPLAPAKPIIIQTHHYNGVRAYDGR